MALPNTITSYWNFQFSSQYWTPLALLPVKHCQRDELAPHSYVCLFHSETDYVRYPELQCTVRYYTMQCKTLHSWQKEVVYFRNGREQLRVIKTPSCPPSKKKQKLATLTKNLDSNSQSHSKQSKRNWCKLAHIYRKGGAHTALQHYTELKFLRTATRKNSGWDVRTLMSASWQPTLFRNCLF